MAGTIEIEWKTEVKLDISKTTARNIKKIRESKQLTLDAAAAITGVSRSMLSQIERGEANPTITVLWKIANGFKVSFTALTESVLEDATVIRRESVQPITEGDGKYINYPIFPFDEKKLFEMYRIVIEPGGFLNAQPHIIGTEEYITVFQGRTSIITGGKEYELKEGDSIHFRSDIEHSYYNPGEKTAQLSMLIYYGRG